MKEIDFVFDRVEGGKYCDYWFRVTGETKAELTDKYMEQSMIEVTEAVFSIQDGQWGIKRLFPFNYDVITPSDDKELYTMLKNVAFKTLKEQNLKAAFNCVYETPCGWCSKWDKKCDKKIPERRQRAKCNSVDDVVDIMDDSLSNKICQSESDHEWECCGLSTVGANYRCKKCGAYKTYPIEDILSNTMTR